MKQTHSLPKNSLFLLSLYYLTLTGFFMFLLLAFSSFFFFFLLFLPLSFFLFLFCFFVSSVFSPIVGGVGAVILEHYLQERNTTACAGF